MASVVCCGDGQPRKPVMSTKKLSTTAKSAAGISGPMGRWEWRAWTPLFLFSIVRQFANVEVAGSISFPALNPNNLA